MNALLDQAVEALTAAGRAQSSWADAAELVCRAVGGDSAGILISQADTQQVEAFEFFALDMSMAREYEQYYYQFDTMLQRIGPPGVWQVSDEQLTEIERRRGPLYGDLHHRYGIQQLLAVPMNLGDGFLGGLVIHRTRRQPIRSADFRTGELAQLTNAVASSFANRYGTVAAARQAIKVALEGDAHVFMARSDGMTQALHGAPPVFRYGQLATQGRRLVHADPAMNAHMQHTIGQAVQGQRGTVTVPVGDAMAVRLEVQPLPAPARLASLHRMALVRLELRDLSHAPREEQLALVFSLTPSQARVLHLLCEGLQPKQCADALDCSVATVRTHISHLMLKLDCSKQAQLVRMALLLA